ESSFHQSGLPCPNRLVESASPMVVTKLLVESDLVAILPRDVAAQYSACGLITELPVELACDMDPYGVITRKGWLLSPAALRDAAPGACHENSRAAGVAARRADGHRDSRAHPAARTARHPHDRGDA